MGDTLLNHNAKSSKRTKLIGKPETLNLNKYLVERNYDSVIGANHKEALTHSKEEMKIANKVQSQISRSNAFSYSNVSCLNNTPAIMDHQFAKLISFVDSANAAESHDLKKMLPPMLCHLFLEMTKSRDWKLASTLLKKYAPIVCPEMADNGEEALLNGHVAKPRPSSIKDLILSLYGVTKKQDVDFLPDVIEFRSSKFRWEITSKSLQLLKKFLSKFGHILILQILQTRFQIHIREDDNVPAENGPINDSAVKPVNGLVAVKEEALVSNKYYLDSLREVVHRFKSFNLPINLHVIENAINVSSVSINKEANHIAGGFEESRILIWPVNQPPLSNDDDLQQQPWSARKPKDYIRASKEDATDDEASTETCSHNRLDQELELNGEALVLRGHSSAVTSVLFSKHHAALYSCSADCTMRLWTTDGTGYQCGSIYRGHNHPIWCMAESSNSFYLATGSKDATARLWVTDREFPVQVYAGHKLDIDAMDFHPNGNYLATASDDLTIRLWSVANGKLVRVFNNNKQPVKDTKFSPDGQYLAAVGFENKVRIYDLAAGKQLMEMKNTSGPMESIAWSSDSKTVAVAAANGVVRLFNLTPTTDSSHRKRSYATGCKRVLKILPNKKNTFTCIGINC